MKFDTPIRDLAKCLLVSFDSTMRSNLSLGLLKVFAGVPDVSWG